LRDLASFVPGMRAQEQFYVLDGFAPEDCPRQILKDDKPALPSLRPADAGLPEILAFSQNPYGLPAICQVPGPTTGGFAGVGEPVSRSTMRSRAHEWGDFAVEGCMPSGKTRLHSIEQGSLTVAVAFPECIARARALAFQDSATGTRRWADHLGQKPLVKRQYRIECFASSGAGFWLFIFQGRRAGPMPINGFLMASMGV